METNGNNGNNGNKPPYLKVEEIDATKVVWSRLVKRDPVKSGFAAEVQIRLEQTKPGRCVQFLFADKKTALGFRDYTKQLMCKKFGREFVVTQIVPATNGQCWVVFTRGNNWRLVESNWVNSANIRPKKKRTKSTS